MNKNPQVSLVITRQIKEKIKQTNIKLSPIKPIFLSSLDYIRFFIWSISNKGKKPITIAQLCEMIDINKRELIQDENVLTMSYRVVNQDHQEHQIYKKLTIELQEELTRQLNNPILLTRKRKSVYVLEACSWLVDCALEYILNQPPEHIYEFFQNKQQLNLSYFKI